MSYDELDICTAVIKATPHYLERIIDKQDVVINQLRWIFGLNCLIILTICLVHLV